MKIDPTPAELTGFALDEAVRRAFGGEYLGWTDPFMEFPKETWPLGESECLVHAEAWAPSTDMEYGEPQGEDGYGFRLIRALNVDVQPSATGNGLGAFIAGLNHEGQWFHAYGSTVLEAGMRAIVLSREGVHYYDSEKAYKL